MRPIEASEEMFDQLAARSGEALISILIPTHHKGRDVSQDPIRLKNQLAEVDSYLASMGHKPRDRDQRLSGARDLLDDVEFWEHQSVGLGLYVETHEVVAVSAPVGVATMWHVSEVFHVRHLLPSISRDRATVLVLTKNAVRLFHGTKLYLQPVEADMPESFDDVNWFVDREYQRQQHPDRAGTSRSRHGHDPSTKADEDRDRFLRAVAAALPEALVGFPLIALGDDDLVERFRNVAAIESTSPANSGVGDPASDSLILELAAPVFAEMEHIRESEALHRAMDSLGMGEASTTISEALPAAVSGRVGTVVIERGVSPSWGRLDATTMSVERHTSDPRPGDVDLLDRLVVETRKKGGTVTTTDAEIAEGDSFVAEYRY